MTLTTVKSFDQAAGEDLVHEMIMHGAYGKTSVISGTSFVDTYYDTEAKEDEYSPAYDYVRVRLTLTAPKEGDKWPAEDTAAIRARALELYQAGGFDPALKVRVELKAHE